MKKIITFLLVLVLSCMSMFSASAAMEETLIVNRQYDDPFINTVANVQRVHGDTYQEELSSETPPGVALCEAAELSDVQEFITACSEARALPVISVRERKEAETVLSAVDALNHKDVTVISDDPALLKYIRTQKLTIRTGLYVSLMSDSLSSKEADSVRRSVRSAPATFCVINAAYASRQVVSELQGLALAVWVDAETSVDHPLVSVSKAVTSGANGIITGDASDTADFVSECFRPNTMTRTPIMIGHRGNPTQAPENSISGFLTAYENGADVFELDVEITKDGEIIIMHDDTLNRTTNYKGNQTVRNMTLSEIKEYRLLANDGSVSDEAVPTFREVLETFRDKDCRIFVEFKGYNRQNVIGAMSLIKEFGMEDRVDVISFNSDLLLQTQKECEGMSTGLLQSPSGITLNPLVAVNTFYSSVIGTQSANSTINPGKGVITEDYLQTATDRGMTIWPWTYTKASADKAFMLCPDGITTDDVQWSENMLKFVQASAERITVFPGKTVDVALTGTTYGRKSTVIDPQDYFVEVITADGLTIENGTMKTKGVGTTSILLGYVAQTADGSEYVLYSQPIEIRSTYFTPFVKMIVAICAAVISACVIVAVTVSVFCSKRHRRK